MTPLLIIADDLTGAADAAAHVFAAGLPAQVAVHPETRIRALPESGALAWNSASRPLPAAAARQRVTRLARLLLNKSSRLREAPVWFKKIDSMMRGPVAAEVQAICYALSTPVAILTPALPHLERIVTGGQLVLGNGRAPLDLASRFGRGRRNRGSSCWPAVVALETVRNPLLLYHAVDEAFANGAPWEPVVLLCDAEDERDLEALAEAALTHPARPLLCGSGALAGAMARRLLALQEMPGQPVPRAAWAGERVLAVIGSRSEQARAQVRNAADGALEVSGVEWVQVRDGQLPPFPAPVGSLILTPAPPDDDGQNADPIHSIRLAEAAAPLARSGGYTRVVVGGGATAEALLARLEIGTLEVTALADVGMPLLRAVTGSPAPGRDPAVPLPDLVLKAGNHGDALLLRRWLCGEEP